VSLIQKSVDALSKIDDLCVAIGLLAQELRSPSILMVFA
jgi:hypothetical protein